MLLTVVELLNAVRSYPGCGPVSGCFAGVLAFVGGVVVAGVVVGLASGLLVGVAVVVWAGVWTPVGLSDEQATRANGPASPAARANVDPMRVVRICFPPPWRPVAGRRAACSPDWMPVSRVSRAGPVLRSGAEVSLRDSVWAHPLAEPENAAHSDRKAHWVRPAAPA